MTTYQVVSFEVLEPAEITFPGDVSQLLVMDRLPLAYNLSDSVSLSVLGWKDFRGLDTLMSHNIYMGLYKLLQQSPAGSHQFPMWDTERQSDILASSEVKLSKKEVIELCWKNRTDAILCLESCNLKLRLEDTTYVRGSLYRPHISGKLTSHWVIYLPDYPKPFLESYVTDSMDYWIGPRTRYSNIYDFTRDISYQNGRRFGEKVTPFWKESSRKIFAGPHLRLMIASEETQDGNWDVAFAAWSKLALSGNNANRAKALYNMAVYYELEDRLDSAANLLDQAVLLNNDSLIRSYQQEIHMRLQKRPAIFLQVEGARLNRLP